MVINAVGMEINAVGMVINAVGMVIKNKTGHSYFKTIWNLKSGSGMWDMCR